MTENKNTFDSDDSNKILINTDFEKLISETAIAGKKLGISYLITLSIIFLLILLLDCRSNQDTQSSQRSVDCIFLSLQVMRSI